MQRHTPHLLRRRWNRKEGGNTLLRHLLRGAERAAPEHIRQAELRLVLADPPPHRLLCHIRTRAAQHSHVRILQRAHPRLHHPRTGLEHTPDLIARHSSAQHLHHSTLGGAARDSQNALLFTAAIPRGELAQRLLITPQPRAQDAAAHHQLVRVNGVLTARERPTHRHDGHGRLSGAVVEEAVAGGLGG